MIPGQVDIDLMNEHMARYAFAARLARGKRALDAGCGAGYGSAELARAALSVVGIDSSPDAIEFARATYPMPNLSFEVASCEALPHADGSFDPLARRKTLAGAAPARLRGGDCRRNRPDCCGRICAAGDS